MQRSTLTWRAALRSSLQRAKTAARVESRKAMRALARHLQAVRDRSSDSPPRLDLPAVTRAHSWTFRCKPLMSRRDVQLRSGACRRNIAFGVYPANNQKCRRADGRALL